MLSVSFTLSVLEELSGCLSDNDLVFLGMPACYLLLVPALFCLFPFVIMVLLFPTVPILRDVLYVLEFYSVFSTTSYTEKVFNRYLSIGIKR